MKNEKNITHDTTHMKHLYFNIIFAVSALWLCSIHLYAQTETQQSDSTKSVKFMEPEDSLWYDPINGDHIHLQRLASYDSLVFVKPNALKALAVDLGINVAVLAWDYYVQDRSYARISRSVLEDHFKRGFNWDNDSFAGNQFAHPYHGGMFYNAAREHGLSYGVSLLYPIIGSGTWEMLCETNRPAMNDLISTGIGGAAIGEVTHRVSDIFFDDSKMGTERVVRELLGTVLNPVRGVKRILSGEMWRVSRYRGKHIIPEPYTFSVGTGMRHFATKDKLKDGISSPYIEFKFNYGDRFDNVHENHPYDWFSVSLLANLSTSQPTIGEMDIVGRIASKQIECKHNWNLDIGFYQTVKYIDHYGDVEPNSCNGNDNNYAIISEAVSFGGGLYAEHIGKRTSFTNDFILSGILFGGSNTDYYPSRRYNYCSGFSIRNHTRFALNQHLTVGNSFYFARQFVPDGYTSEELEHRTECGLPINKMGDKGCTSVFMNRTYLSINIIKNLRLDMERTYFYRRSHHFYFPSVHKKSYEYKMGVIYSI